MKHDNDINIDDIDEEYEDDIDEMGETEPEAETINPETKWCILCHEAHPGDTPLTTYTCGHCKYTSNNIELMLAHSQRKVDDPRGPHNTITIVPHDLQDVVKVFENMMVLTKTQLHNLAREWVTLLHPQGSPMIIEEEASKLTHFISSDVRLLLLREKP